MDPESNKPHEERTPTTMAKVLVLIGLIILLIIGILLPIKLVPSAVTGIKDYFSSLFRRTSVELSTNKEQIISGEPFTLSWSGATRENGSYILSYPCNGDI